MAEAIGDGLRCRTSQNIELCSSTTLREGDGGGARGAQGEGFDLHEFLWPSNAVSGHCIDDALAQHGATQRCSHVDRDHELSCSGQHRGMNRVA